MYRLFTIAVVLLWLAAMAALFKRDVWPAWTAQDAPPMTVQQFARLDQRQQQYALLGAAGQRYGTAWSKVILAGGNATLQGTVVLDGVPMIPPVRVETSTDFEPDGGIDNFMLDVYGVPVKIRVRGERRGVYFPCELQVGTLFRQANLDVSACRMIGDGLRPFSYLPTLEVGQAWRMQILDPLAAVLHNRAEFTSIVARVTGKETLHTMGPPTECWIVETAPQRVKAWVAPDGQVRMQEVELPGLGKLTVREEPLEQTAQAQARQRIRSRGKHGSNSE